MPSFLDKAKQTLETAKKNVSSSLTSSSAMSAALTDDNDSESEANAEEIAILLETFEKEEDEAPLTRNMERSLSISLARTSYFSAQEDQEEDKDKPAAEAHSLESFYGHPLSVEETTKLMPPGEGGLIWHSLLINGDPFETDGSLKKGLNERDFDKTKQTIKPRRASLPIKAQDFFGSITKIEGPRYIFHGILNGWPSLQTFEVMSIQRKRDKPVNRPLAIVTGQRLWAPMWSVDKEGKQGVDPKLPSPQNDNNDSLVFRIKLRGAPWSSRGWSQESPGFCFWYEAQKEQPTLTYGTQMIQDVDPDPICTNLYMVSHRYARAKETTKDKLTYHSLVLLEWDHGDYCTVVEAAYLNGLGGWRGKSNFYHDMNEPITQMYECFPAEMVGPWLTNAAEIRGFDVEAKNLEEFQQYLAKYEGHNGRFVDAVVNFRHQTRLTHRSKKDIAHYLNNYIQRDVTYSELRRNCQTLAADLCAFLAGKKEVMPYHSVNRIEYVNRSHLFLYQPEMYDQSQPSSLQANQVKG